MKRKVSFGHLSGFRAYESIVPSPGDPAMVEPLLLLNRKKDESHSTLLGVFVRGQKKLQGLEFLGYPS